MRPHLLQTQGSFGTIALQSIWVPGLPNDTFGSPLKTNAVCGDDCYDREKGLAFWGFANTALKWDRLRKASDIDGLVTQGYRFQLLRPRQPDDPANVTDIVVVAESGKDVSPCVGMMCDVSLCGGLV